MTILDDLKQDEGFRRSVYFDSLGFATIGYGFLVDARRGGGIPEEVADIWLAYLIDEKRGELDTWLPWWRKQPEQVQRALLNMSYQLGIAGLLKFKTTLSRLQAGDREGAADSALQSLWARQTPNRAQRVTDLIRGVT